MKKDEVISLILYVIGLIYYNVQNYEGGLFSALSKGEEAAKDISKAEEAAKDISKAEEAAKQLSTSEEIVSNLGKQAKNVSAKGIEAANKAKDAMKVGDKIEAIKQYSKVAEEATGEYASLLKSSAKTYMKENPVKFAGAIVSSSALAGYMIIHGITNPFVAMGQLVGNTASGTFTSLMMGLFGKYWKYYIAAPVLLLIIAIVYNIVKNI